MLVKFNYLIKSIQDIDDKLTNDYYVNREEFIRKLDEIIFDDRKLFLEALTIRILRANSDFKVKEIIRSYVTLINRSAQMLKSIKGKDAQRIIIDRYSNSYTETKAYLAIRYEGYYPQTEMESLSAIRNKNLEIHIFQDQILKFKEINSRVVEYGFAKYENGSYFWKGKKNELVDFCRVLNSNSILNKNIKLTKHIHFFEDFYNVNVGDQYKPNKFRTLDLTKFKHLFI